MKKESSFLHSVDKDQVQNLMQETNVNVEYFNDTCANVTKGYSKPLDDLMLNLYRDCIKIEDPSTKTLEKYYLELANLLYFMGENLEKLGIYSDMSKSAAKEMYSKSYLATQVKEALTGKNKTTIAECQAKAELDAQYEAVVRDMYIHCEENLKYKINAAQDMLNTLRKILSGRQIEMNNFISDSEPTKLQ